MTGFASRKAELLLVYLACNPHFHQREVLAELLWDDRPQRRALSNLRVVLASLRKNVGPFVAISRDKVGVAPAADIWLDAVQLEGALSRDGLPEAWASLVAALDLCHGDFLAGVHVRDALRLEEWMRRERERLHQLAVLGCQRLVEHELERGDYRGAIASATRLLELDPLLESGHRQLMQAYTLAGERATALAHFQTWCALLQDELGVDPAAETVALYQRIRDGFLPQRPPAPTVTPSVNLPSFLSAPPAAKRETAFFVAREEELAWLRLKLKEVIGGDGRILFIAGEAGMGKTALLQEFARRATEEQGDLLVATGRGSALGEAGDPYLPFRQLLSQLTGAVEAPLAAGHLTLEQATRLWRGVPDAVTNLLRCGPDLIHHLLSPSALLARARQAAGGGGAWLTPVEQLLVKEARPLRETTALQQQVTEVLQSLSRQHPLLILLDDGQWADDATLALLFHLTQQLSTTRILVIVAFRSEEVIAGSGEPHPLLRVLHEAQRRFSQVELDLAQAMRREGRTFVDELLDTEPNRLGDGFRQELLQRTGGHPFFTVELLRAMQARGDLLQDDEGRWMEGQRLDWQRLPAQVTAVIAERIDPLPYHLQRLVEVASVEGERFTVAVLAQVQQLEQRTVLRQLSADLDRRYRLVRAEGWDELNGRRVARYRFRHALFSQYIYEQLDELERLWLHEAIGLALEALYGEKAAVIAPQLARHFHQAQVIDKAVAYYLQAGKAARALYAHEEAIDHYRQALALQKQSRAYDEAARTLMKLGLTYHQAFDYRQAQQAYDEALQLARRAASMPPPLSLAPAPHPLRLVLTNLLTIDPALANCEADFVVARHLFPGLVEERDDEIIPDSAARWEIVDGGRTYLFHLRRDVRWSDGAPLTAHDFEFAWKRLLAMTPPSPTADLLFDIRGARAYHEARGSGEAGGQEKVGVVAADAHTLVVELEQPSAYFLSLVACPQFRAVPRHVVTVHPETWAESPDVVSSGPFCLESWQRGERLELLRNRYHHQPAAGNLERVILLDWHIPPEERERRQQRLYEAGEVDVVSCFRHVGDPLERQRFMGEHIDELRSGPSGHQTSGLLFDLRLPHLSDRRVRRALAHAVNRDRLMQALVPLDIEIVPAEGGFVPPYLPGHSPAIALPFDPARAQRLLARAGYPGGADFPPLTLELPCTALTDAIGALLIRQWQQYLSISVDLRMIPWRDWTRFDRRNPPPLYWIGWRYDYPDPDNFLRVCWSRQQPSWRNERYERLIDEARALLDQERRLALYREADRLLIEGAFFVPLFYHTIEHTLVQPWVKLYRGRFWEDVIIEPH